MKSTFAYTVAAAAVLFASSTVAASTLYGIAQGTKLTTIDQATAAQTLVGTPEANRRITGLTSDWRAESFRLWGLDVVADNLFQVDPNTSHATLIGHLSADISSVAFDVATEQLYGISNDSLYQVDTNTAALTLIAPTSASVNWIAFGPTGILYGNAAQSLVTINTSSGVVSQIGSFNHPPTISHFAVRPEDGAIFAVETGVPTFLYSINSATGKATLINHMTSSIFPPIDTTYGITFSEVPEPSAFALLFLGAAFGAVRRRSRPDRQ